MILTIPVLISFLCGALALAGGTAISMKVYKGKTLKSVNEEHRAISKKIQNGKIILAKPSDRLALTASKASEKTSDDEMIHSARLVAQDALNANMDVLYDNLISELSYNDIKSNVKAAAKIMKEASKELSDMIDNSVHDMNMEIYDIRRASKEVIAKVEGAKLAEIAKVEAEKAAKNSKNFFHLEYGKIEDAFKKSSEYIKSVEPQYALGMPTSLDTLRLALDAAKFDFERLEATNTVSQSKVSEITKVLTKAFDRYNSSVKPYLSVIDNMRELSKKLMDDFDNKSKNLTLVNNADEIRESITKIVSEVEQFDFLKVSNPVGSFSEMTKPIIENFVTLRIVPLGYLTTIKRLKRSIPLFDVLKDEFYVASRATKNQTEISIHSVYSQYLESEVVRTTAVAAKANKEYRSVEYAGYYKRQAAEKKVTAAAAELKEAVRVRDEYCG